MAHRREMIAKIQALSATKESVSPPRPMGWPIKTRERCRESGIPPTNQVMTSDQVSRLQDKDE